PPRQRRSRKRAAHVPLRFHSLALKYSSHVVSKSQSNIHETSSGSSFPSDAFFEDSELLPSGRRAVVGCPLGCPATKSSTVRPMSFAICRRRVGEMSRP